MTGSAGSSGGSGSSGGGAPDVGPSPDLGPGPDLPVDCHWDDGDWSVGRGWEESGSLSIVPGAGLQADLNPAHYYPSGDVTGDGARDLIMTVLERFTPMEEVEPPPGFFVLPGGSVEGTTVVDEWVGGEGPAVYVDESGPRRQVDGVAAGDYDGDGIGDLAAWVFPDPPTDPWRVYVLWGPLGSGPVLLDEAVLAGDAVAVPMPAESDRVLVGLPLGDFDGDGRADLGAINRVLGAVPYEEEWALVLPSSGAREAPDLEGALAGEVGLRLSAGPQARPTHVIALGDFDGDELDDIMLPLAGSGNAFPHLIVYGRSEPGKVQVDEVPPEEGFYVQIRALSGGYYGQPGDVNGDGQADYVFADRFPDGSDIEGAFVVLYGRPRGLDVVKVEQIPDVHAGVRLEEIQIWVAGGDVDGDGYMDLLVEENNWYWVLYGGPNLPGVVRPEDLWCGRVRASRLPSPFRLDGEGVKTPQAGQRLADFNGDGLADPLLLGWADSSDFGQHISFAPTP